MSIINLNTLNSGVTNSSLTTVGTLNTLSISGDLTIDTNTLKVDSTNNRVGIRTATPGVPLHLFTTTSGGWNTTHGQRIGGFGANAGYMQIGVDFTNGRGWIHTFLNGASGEGTGSYTNLCLNEAGGNVGIGTTNPTEKLVVNGPVRSTNTTKAWVSFNGIPATPTILASYNITSVSKTATGRYTINFTSAQPNTNYGIVASGGDGIGSARFVTAPFTVKGTTNFNISTGTYQSDDDFNNVCVAIFNTS